RGDRLGRFSLSPGRLLRNVRLCCRWELGRSTRLLRYSPIGGLRFSRRLLVGARAGLELLLEALEGSGHPADVEIPPGVAELNRLVTSKWPHGVWELIGVRHLRVLDESRNHTDASGERGFQLEANEVVRAIKTASAFRVRRREPASTDERNH